MEQFSAQYARLEVPKDADGFAVAFEDPASDAARDFFNRYGFVVCKNALTQQDCKESLDEVWDCIKRESWRRLYIIGADDGFAGGDNTHVSAVGQTWRTLLPRHARVQCKLLFCPYCSGHQNCVRVFVSGHSLLEPTLLATLQEAGSETQTTFRCFCAVNGARDR
eukprot:2223565-Rhodomonas_salina.6